MRHDMKLTHLLSSGILVTVVAATAMTQPNPQHLTIGGQTTNALAVGETDRLTASTSRLDLPTSNRDRQGATVTRGFPCGVPVPGIGEVATTNSHSVVTPSGNAALSCHGSTPIVVPQTLVFKDLPCGTLGAAGTSSHLVVTDTGRVNFWCHHHK
jgi:hypothetical protein